MTVLPTIHSVPTTSVALTQGQDGNNRKNHEEAKKFPDRPGAEALTIRPGQSLDVAKPIWIRRR